MSQDINYPPDDRILLLADTCTNFLIESKSKCELEIFSNNFNIYIRIFDILNNYIIFYFSYKFTEEQLEEFYPEGKM